MRKYVNRLSNFGLCSAFCDILTDSDVQKSVWCIQSSVTGSD